MLHWRAPRRTKKTDVVTTDVVTADVVTADVVTLPQETTNVNNYYCCIIIVCIAVIVVSICYGSIYARIVAHNRASEIRDYIVKNK